MMHFRGNSSSIEIRNYRKSDLEQLERIFLVTYRDKFGSREYASHIFRVKLKKPGFHPGKDLFVAEMGIRIIGFSSVTHERKIGRAVGEVFVHPSFQGSGAGSRMMNSCLERAGVLGARFFHSSVAGENSEGKGFLEAMGFSPVRTFLEMSVSLKTEPEKSEEISGGRFTGFQSGEEAVLARIQNRIFVGTWGFCPNTPSEIKYYLSLTNSRLEDILALEYRNQKIGYFWFHNIPSQRGRKLSKRARIHMLGIRREFRGKGWGRKLLREGLNHMKKLGFEEAELTVDSANSPASRLYGSVGFKVRSRTLWYEKERNKDERKHPQNRGRFKSS